MRDSSPSPVSPTSDRDLVRSFAGPGLATLACLVVAVGWGPLLYTHFADDYLLRLVWGSLVLFTLVNRDADHDVPLVFVAAAGGLCIEAWGTTTGLWHYFTDERPPPWIIPAWPMAALATLRLAGLFQRRLTGGPWVTRAVLAAFTAWMAHFLWPSIEVWTSWVVLALMIGVTVTVRRGSRDLPLFLAGAAIGWWLEYWGTTSGCWTYYTGGTPPLVTAFAHGMATVAFERGVLLVQRVRRPALAS